MARLGCLLCGLLVGLSPLAFMFLAYTLDSLPAGDFEDVSNAVSTKVTHLPNPALKPWEEHYYRYLDKDSNVDMQVWCTAVAIFFEASSEAYSGQVMVGQVVLNRVRTKGFPDTPCEVVYQPSRKPIARPLACQFSFTCKPQDRDIQDEVEAWGNAMSIAYSLIYGYYEGPWTKATHYHKYTVKPSWAKHKKYLGTVGVHLTYVKG